MRIGLIHTYCKSVYLRLILDCFRNLAVSHNFVKNEVTVDATSMIIFWLIVLFLQLSIVFIRRRPTLLVLRSDGYHRCHETAGRVTIRILRFFFNTTLLGIQRSTNHYHKSNKWIQPNINYSLSSWLYIAWF